jgi:RNA polymerase subunit RPABC4/transcription elongation factor Spt4
MVRRLCWLIAAVVLVTGVIGGAMALDQGKKTHQKMAGYKMAHKEKAKMAGPAFVCPTCEVGSDKKENCPLCGAKMVNAKTYKPTVTSKEAMIHCPKCRHWVPKGTKECPVCKKMGAGKAKDGKHGH